MSGVWDVERNYGKVILEETGLSGVNLWHKLHFWKIYFEIVCFGVRSMIYLIYYMQLMN